MTIEESAEKLNQSIEWIVTNSGDVRSDVKRLLLKKLQAERDDMRERAANRADGSLLVGSEIAKEIRDLK